MEWACKCYTKHGDAVQLQKRTRTRNYEGKLCSCLATLASMTNYASTLRIGRLQKRVLSFCIDERVQNLNTRQVSSVGHVCYWMARIKMTWIMCMPYIAQLFRTTVLASNGHDIPSVEHTTLVRIGCHWLVSQVIRTASPVSHFNPSKQANSTSLSL